MGRHNSTTNLRNAYTAMHRLGFERVLPELDLGFAAYEAEMAAGRSQALMRRKGGNTRAQLANIATMAAAEAEELADVIQYREQERAFLLASQGEIPL